MQTDKEVLMRAQPYLRSLLAFILYTAHRTQMDVDQAYKEANEFIDRLYREVQ